MEHTPTPWQWWLNAENCNYELVTVKPGHWETTRFIATVHKPGESSAAINSDQAQANAAFIAKAVNNHDKLVEALKNLLAECEAYRGFNYSAGLLVAARTALADVEASQ